MAICFSFIGDSNAGGRSLVCDARVSERVARLQLLIWNILFPGFEPLFIGKNNNLDHANVTPPSHVCGWEVEIANQIDAGEWGPGPHYLIQGGQGGATTANWANNSSYMNKYLAQLNQAKVYWASAGIQPQHVVFISLGINDAKQSVSTATYKTNLADLISRIKVQLPNAVFVLPELPVTYATHTVAMKEVCDADDSVTWAASIDLPTYDLDHWDKPSMDMLSSRMQQNARAMLGLTSELTWSHIVGFTLRTARRLTSTVSSGTAGAISKKVIPIPNGWSLAWDTVFASGIAIVLESTKDTNHVWAGSTFIAGSYANSGSVFSAATQQSGGTANIGASARYQMMKRVGDNLAIYVSADLVTWTLRGNAGSNILAGLTQAFVHVMNASTSSDDALSIWMPRLRLPLVTHVISGQQTTISWIDDRSSTYNVQLSIDGGTTWSALATGLSSPTYNWIPDDTQLTTQAMLRVVDATDATQFAYSQEFRVLSSSTVSLDALMAVASATNTTVQANLDQTVSSRAEPGDAMSLTGSALNYLGGRSIETVNPVGAGGRVDLVIGDDYSSEDGRQLKWIVTGAHASLATAQILLAVKQASGAAIEFIGDVSTIDANLGKYLISVNLDNVDTSDLLAGWADYQLVAVIDGRRNTQLFGRTQQTPRLV